MNRDNKFINTINKTKIKSLQKTIVQNEWDELKKMSVNW